MMEFEEFKMLRIWPTVVCLFLALHYAVGQSSPIAKAVEVDYGELLQQPHVTVPISVQFTAFSDGRPFSFESFDGGLEPNVVRALSQYEFARSAQGIRVTTMIPVKRLISTIDSEGHLYATPARADAEAATGLTPDRAAKLERDLPKKNSTPKRAVLLTYAATHQDEASKQMRVRQLEWLLENDVEADVLRTTVALIPRQEDAAGYANIKARWLALVEKDPFNRFILEGATNFLKMSDPDEARTILLRRASQSLSVMEWYGGMLGEAAIGVTAIDPLSGDVLGATLRADGFGARVHSQLMVETQLPLLLSAFRTMNKAARSLVRVSPLPAGYEDFCNRLRARIVAGKPEFNEPCETNLPQVRSFVSGDVMRGKIISQTRPSYPAVAKAKGIQGTVALTAVISREGKITNLGVRKGPFALIEESLAAVASWRYKPYEISGQPVEVLTEIEVNYALQ